MEKFKGNPSLPLRSPTIGSLKSHDQG